MTTNMEYCHAVMIGDKVYVGGGDSYTGSNAHVAMVYDTHVGSWISLPAYKCRWFSMAAVNNQLVLVGGKMIPPPSNANVLGVWDERSQTWTHPFPEMPTPRYSTSVICYQRWLIVAGGTGYRSGFDVSKVEILDTQSMQWYEGPPLPKKCSQMSSTINGNMWYLSSGVSGLWINQQVFSVCLDELISQAISAQPAGAISPSTSSPWHILTDIPLKHSTILILNGGLLAIGGKRSSAIYHYQPSSRSWVEVNHLPTKRSRCACVTLPTGEIFVAGGRNEEAQLDWAQPRYLHRCDIATIM